MIPKPIVVLHYPPGTTGELDNYAIAKSVLEDITSEIKLNGIAAVAFPRLVERFDDLGEGWDLKVEMTDGSEIKPLVGSE